LARQNAIPKLLGHDSRILATDLDSDVLAHAKRGRYTDESLAAIHPDRLRTFSKGDGGESHGQNRVSRQLRQSVVFLHLNLMDAWPMRGSFDAIFCRNVLIYFTKEMQRVLFERIADLLGVVKCLFLGHSESLTELNDRFEYAARKFTGR
jgi:chemotaxis protein methyltransferase CheR